jgi:hypothetical protein
LDATGNLDKLLLTVRDLNLEGLNISPFEREILEDVKTQV